MSLLANRSFFAESGYDKELLGRNLHDALAKLEELHGIASVQSENVKSSTELYRETKRQIRSTLVYIRKLEHQLSV